MKLVSNPITILSDEDYIKLLKAENAKLTATVQSQQAEIDRLMLEFCPDEMTKEQLSNWEAHQKLSNSDAL